VEVRGEPLGVSSGRTGGQEARTGRSSGDRGEGRALIDTLEIAAGATARSRREGHERRGREGGPKGREETPEGAQPQEGMRGSRGANPPRGSTESVTGTRP